MIDMHAHAVPEDPTLGMRDGLRGGAAWPAMVVLEDGRRAVTVGKVRRVLDENAWDLRHRCRVLDAQHIGLQVVSPMPSLIPTWAPDKAAGEYSRRLNAWLAEQIASVPHRYLGFGVAPMHDLDGAITALSQIRRLGMAGVEVPSRVGESSIGSAEFGPFFAAAAELDLIVFIHAVQSPEWLCFSPGIVANAVTFPPEVGLALNMLLTTGTLAALPNLRLLASHGGGTFVFTLGRLRYAWERSAELRAAAPEDPLEYARRIYVDTLVFDPNILRFVAETLGEERIVTGTDHPFVELPAGALLESVTGLSNEFEGRVRASNALRLLRR